MVKLKIVLLCCILMSASYGFAARKTSACPPTQESVSNQPQIRPLIETKLGYFFFGSSKMRDIFKSGGFDVQLSGSYPIWKWLQIYGSVEYLTRHGRSLVSHERTSIWEVPLSLGLQPVVVICPQIHYYFTLGPRYFFVHTHASSPYVDKTLNENGCGLFINTGFHFFPVAHFVVDVFGEYSYKQMHFHPHKSNVYGQTTQVGGFTFGGGLGYAF